MSKGMKLSHNHVAEGESTGHFHAAEGATAVYDLGDGLRSFEGGTRSVTITHQEHQPIVMPRRRMLSGICREFDHLAEEAKAVQD